MVSSDTTRIAGADPFRLERNKFGRLVLIDAQGQRHEGIEPVRAFPLSDPRKFVSLCDVHGSEIVALQNLDELAPQLCAMIDEELARREFVPVIERIVVVPGGIGPALHWEVRTDRGVTRLT